MSNEASEQIRLANRLTRAGVRFCHVPNGEYRRKVDAVLLKKMGVKPGVPDILIFDLPPILAHIKGVAVEMKSLKAPKPAGGQRFASCVSKGQVEWLSALEENGWLVRVCYGFLEAVQWLRGLGYVV